MAIAVTAIDRRLTSCPLVEEVGGRRQHLRGALVRARHLSLMPERGLCATASTSSGLRGGHDRRARSVVEHDARPDAADGVERLVETGIAAAPQTPAGDRRGAARIAERAADEHRARGARALDALGGRGEDCGGGVVRSRTGSA